MISVIIPVFNVEKYLDDCLLSVRQQSYTHLEIIVVDDGSTDSSATIARRHSELDSRVIIVSQQNSGLSAARNTGLRNASGSWVTFVDGDDMLLPEALSLMSRTARLFEADVVAANLTRRKPRDGRFNNLKPKQYTPDDAIRSMLYQTRLNSSVCAKLFARHLFTGDDFRPGILYEDLDAIFKIVARANKIVTINAPLYFYRPSPASILHTFNRQRFDVLDVTENLEQWASEISTDILRAARDRRLSAAFNILGLIIANNQADKYPDTTSTCRNIIRNYRKASLLNPKVRLKNKVGILISYMGNNILNPFLRHHYRN